jgi:hypothetical protein
MVAIWARMSAERYAKQGLVARRELVAGDRERPASCSTVQSWMRLLE